MKKIMVIFIAMVFFFLAVGTKAEGDKMRGDESSGPAYQNGECPFVG